MSTPDPEFAELLNRLTALARRENSRLRADLDDEGGPVYGTRDGYVLLAAALIEAGLDPETNASGHSIARVDASQPAGR